MAPTKTVGAAPRHVSRAVPKKPGFFASKGGLLLLIGLGLVYIHTHGKTVWKNWLLPQLGPFWAPFVAVLVVPDVYFFLVTGLYAILDLVPSVHEWAIQFKTQPEEPSPDWKKYLQVLWVVLRNTLLVEIPVTLIYAYRASQNPEELEELPSVGMSIALMVLFSLSQDVLFFSSHRTLHHPWIFKHFHRQHHSFTAPCALSAKYCSMFEHLFQNLLSVAGIAFTLGAHPMLAGLYVCIATTSAACIHSGYDLLTVLVRWICSLLFLSTFIYWFFLF